MVPRFGPVLRSTAMEGKEFTRMFLPVMEALIPLMLVMIRVAGVKMPPPSIDLAKPMAVSSDGQVS